MSANLLVLYNNYDFTRVYSLVILPFHLWMTHKALPLRKYHLVVTPFLAKMYKTELVTLRDETIKLLLPATDEFRVVKDMQRLSCRSSYLDDNEDVRRGVGDAEDTGPA